MEAAEQPTPMMVIFRKMHGGSIEDGDGGWKMENDT